MIIFRIFLSFLILGAVVGCGDAAVTTDTTTTVLATPTPAPVPVYFDLVVSPGDDTLVMVDSSFRYTVEGGKPPYRFSLVSGPGSINETSGVFSAGDILGNSIVDIKDSSGLVVTLRVRAVPLLTASPLLAKLNTSAGIQLVVGGGVPPYHFNIISGSGDVNLLGYYSAPATPSSAVIEVTDSQAGAINSTIVQVNVNYPLTLNPTGLSVNRGDSATFEGKNGFPPYTYTVTGGGTINNATGAFIAPSYSGSSLVKVMDSAGNSATGVVVTNSLDLGINSQNLTVQVNKSFGFKASGGLAPYLFRLWVPALHTCSSGTASWSSFFCSSKNYTDPESCYNGGAQWKYCSRLSKLSCEETVSLQLVSPGCYDSAGVITSKTESQCAVETDHQWFVNGTPDTLCSQILKGIPSSLINSAGTIIAPAAPDVFRVQLKDGENTEIFSTVNVSNSLTISPAQMVTTPNLIETFQASGGVPPYTFQILTGAGSITNSSDNSLGEFTAPAAVGTTKIQLRDSVNTIVTADVEVSPDLHIFPLNPTIAIGNSINFIGNGGVAPYRYDIVTGPGIMNVNGTFTSDSGVIFAPQTTVVRITDAKEIKRLSTITINPAVDFAEHNMIVTSGLGAFKNITAINGVPPYKLKFKNNASSIGSTIENIPNGSGGFTMKYSPRQVNDDVFEKLQITDSLGNIVEENISVFGGLVAYYDPDKSKFGSIDNQIGIDSIKLTNNSDLAEITSPIHGLGVTSTLRIKDSASCSNFEDYDFNKRFTPNIIDGNLFSIGLPRRATEGILCGNGTNFKYDTLSNITDTCPASGSITLLNLRNYSTSEISANCSVSGAAMFTGTCGKTPSLCSTETHLNVDGKPVKTNNAYRAKVSKISVADPLNRDLKINVPLTSTAGTSVSVEMWLLWDGERTPQISGQPPQSTFDGTVVGFNNYNVSFITIANGSVINKSLCFNTQIGALDCYGTGGTNIDSLIRKDWHHFVFIFNNGDVTKSKIYVDGRDYGLSKQGLVEPISRVVGNELKIGVNYNNNNPVFRIRGDVGVVRVYDKEIDGNQVILNYNEFKCLYQPCSN